MNVISSGKFHGHSVNCGSQNQFKLRVDILEVIYTRLRFMTNEYPKVMLLRYDLRFPAHFRFEYGEESLKKFMNFFSIFLKRKGVPYQYVWVREKNQSDNVHYHCVFFIDADWYERSDIFNNEAQALWSRICSDASYSAPRSLIHLCEMRQDDDYYTRHVILSRDEPYFEDEFSDCFDWVSYLAKTNTKIENPGRGNRGWGCSRCEECN